MPDPSILTGPEALQVPPVVVTEYVATAGIQIIDDPEMTPVDGTVVTDSVAITVFVPQALVTE